jgi:hypothetical protein
VISTDPSVREQGYSLSSERTSKGALRAPSMIEPTPSGRCRVEQKPRETNDAAARPPSRRVGRGVARRRALAASAGAADCRERSSRAARLRHFARDADDVEPEQPACWSTGIVSRAFRPCSRYRWPSSRSGGALRLNPCPGGVVRIIPKVATPAPPPVVCPRASWDLAGTRGPNGAATAPCSAWRGRRARRTSGGRAGE